jgi:quercetin dioxygenase-like cupin family protein
MIILEDVRRTGGFTMRVVKIDEVKKEAIVSPLFTGSEVTRQVLLPDSRELNITVVNFGKGVRNKFHAHDSEQILIVTSGRGFIVTEMERKEISAGDIVIIPAGEKHWHGATEDTAFSHIFVSRLGSQATQLEE